MDSFEALIRLLLEQDGYWTRHSHKVNVSKDEKRLIGKPSIPRPEIDIIAYKPAENRIVAMEVKSYLDSLGVQFKEIDQSFDVPEGRYKLFTCENYRKIVFNRILDDLKNDGLADSNTKIQLALSAGKIYAKDEENIVTHFDSKNWMIWTPRDIAERIQKLSEMDYENDPYIITSKLIHRNPLRRET